MILDLRQFLRDAPQSLGHCFIVGARTRLDLLGITAQFHKPTWPHIVTAANIRRRRRVESWQRTHGGGLRNNRIQEWKVAGMLLQMGGGPAGVGGDCQRSLTRCAEFALEFIGE
jgi:hypothetical protein